MIYYSGTHIICGEDREGTGLPSGLTDKCHQRLKNHQSLPSLTLSFHFELRDRGAGGVCHNTAIGSSKLTPIKRDATRKRNKMFPPTSNSKDL